MKVTIGVTDWYPVFYLTEDSIVWLPCEVPREAIERWEKVFSDFDAVQREMENYQAQSQKRQ